MKILLTLIPNAQHQIHQCLCYKLQGMEERAKSVHVTHITVSPPRLSEEDPPICLNVLFGKLSPCIFSKQTNKQINKSYKSNKIKMYHIENARIHALNLSALFERDTARAAVRKFHVGNGDVLHLFSY